MVRGRLLSETTPEVHEVAWLNLPTEAFLASLRHLEDLTHELRLVDAGDRSGVVDVPPALASTMEAILGAYPAPRREVWRQALQAAEAGRERLDLILWLPLSAVDASRRLLGLLEQADELCREAILMTIPATEAVVEIRRWTCAELERQLVHGARPVPHP